LAKLILNGATSGSISIESPAVSGSNTLTLPANTGTVITTGSTFGGTGPAFSAYQNSATSLTQNVWTKLQFQVEEWDTANCYDNSTNYRFTPNVAGYYLVTGSFQVATTAGLMQLALYKNGSSVKYIAQQEPNSGFAMGSAQVYLNGTTDYIELYARQDKATQNSFVSSQSTFFQASMVRSA